jgi:hypothetical protein
MAYLIMQSANREAGWGAKMGWRFSYFLTPSKNPRLVSRTQAYIAYLLSR